MAEAIARSLGGDRVEVFSAGLSPLGWISSETFDALRTLGYPVGDLRSKGLDAIDLDDLDIVVSLLGDRGLDSIPHSIGGRREAWAIVDPFGEDDALYLDVAHDLEGRIRQLLEEEKESELFSP
jgi:protein-tyrosine-phosphatase